MKLRLLLSRALIALAACAVAAPLLVTVAAADTTATLQVSGEPNRSGARALDSSTLSGNAYIFLSATNVRSVTFVIDALAADSGNPSVENWSPYDLAHTAPDGSARPFNTSDLSEGRHIVAAQIVSTDGTTSTSEASFTVSDSSTVQPSWFSGAGLDQSNNGPTQFGTWRGEATGALGAWDDVREAQENIWSLDVGALKNWNGPMDIAVGAIYRESSETWAAAATGAYDARWRKSLTRIKEKLGSRDADLVNVRFAHEMNGNWFPWRVATGEEANFKAALIRYSNVRYEVFSGTDVPQLVLCANDGTSGGYADPRNLFVGKDAQNRPVVDLYCVDSYNSWPHRTNKTDIVGAMSRTGANGVPIGVEAHRKFAEESGVPFSVGEWGNCARDDLCGAGGGGESRGYVEAMNEWFRAHAGDPKNPQPGQVVYELYFDLLSQYQLYPVRNQPETSLAYAALVWGR